MDITSIHRGQTPLIILDVQEAIDQPVWDGKNNPEYLASIQRLFAYWRTNQWPVLHIKHDEKSPTSTYHTYGLWNALKKEVAPDEGECVIVKHQNCAFIGTELQSTLKQMKADSFVIAGVVIHNSMDATIRAGKALGYTIFLPADATTAVPVKGKDGQFWDAGTVYDLTLAILGGEYSELVTVDELLLDFNEG